MRLLVFGMGYTAQAVHRALDPSQARCVVGTTRSHDRAATLRDRGIDMRLFPGDELASDLATASHVLVTAGPAEGRDPVLAQLAEAFVANAARLDWVGYLSTTGVYGDHCGGWVDEETPPAPSTRRGRDRLAAEHAWLGLHRDHGLPVHIFRLPGIYGPGRGPFAKVRAGTARRIVKPGQVFSRIHVHDLADALVRSMRRPDPGRVYNICDDEPAPPQDVIAHAAKLLGLPLPPEIPFEAADLSPMARNFYSESKRVDNARMRRELGDALRYPSYRDGLAAILRAEGSDGDNDDD